MPAIWSEVKADDGNGRAGGTGVLDMLGELVGGPTETGVAVCVGPF